MRMTDVITDIIVDIRDIFKDDLPDYVRLERFFNEAQLDLAIRLECITGTFVRTTDYYQSETGLVMASGTTTRKVRSTGFDDVTNNDAYNGWRLVNTTRNAETVIVNCVANATYQDCALAREIVGQIAPDGFYVEKICQSMEMPWYLIRPNMDQGVMFDDQEVRPGVSLNEIKNYYRTNNTYAGTPRNYAMENRRMWFLPQPDAAGLLEITGPRRPGECFSGATTSNGASDGTTLISTNLPQKPVGYWEGCEVEIRSGTYAGEVRKISDYVPSTSTIYVGEVFSGQIASGVTVEILPMVDDEFKPALECYMRAKTFDFHEELSKLADREWAKYFTFVPGENYDILRTRRNTRNITIGGKRSSMFGKKRYVIQSE